MVIVLPPNTLGDARRVPRRLRLVLRTSACALLLSGTVPRNGTSRTEMNWANGTEWGTDVPSVPIQLSIYSASS